MRKMPITTVYNIDDIVNILKHVGISRTSIYRAIATEKLKAVKVGKRYLISEKALNKFLEGGINDN